jgi:type IV secretion system protein VirD4
MLSKCKMTKKQLIGSILLFMIFVPVILYISGIIGQFIYSYDTWMKSGNIGSGQSVMYPNFHFLYSLQFALANPNGHRGLQFMLLLATGFGVYFIIKDIRFRKGYDTERKFSQSPTGTYGTSGWMQKKEMDQVLDVKPIGSSMGTILGELGGNIVCFPVHSRLNKHVAIYGAPGVGKSRCFVINQIIQCARRGESIILTDSKGELYSATSEYLRSLGYTVKIFNLITPESSDSWNCLDEVQGDQIRAQMFVDIIMNNTTSGKVEQFWENAEKNLLKALILYVDMQPSFSPVQKTMGTVYNMLVHYSDKQLEDLFAKLDDDHPAQLPYKLYLKNKNDKVTGGIAQGLGNRLQVFQAKAIRNITARSDIDLTLPAKEKCAYFTIVSDQDSTYDFLSSLYFSFLFIDIVRYADAYGKNGQCDVPVNFVLDEFPNIGAIPDFTKKLATIRSRDMSVDVIFQNLAQLKNRYPNDLWQEIIGCCDTQLFLGCTDALSAEFISKQSGEITIEVESNQKWFKTIRLTDYTPEFRATASVGRRNLLNPDEVRRLSNDDALVIIRGEKILKVRKFDYSHHPESRKFKPCNIRDYIPSWRLSTGQAAAKFEQLGDLPDRGSGKKRKGKKPQEESSYEPMLQERFEEFTQENEELSK